MLSVGDRGPRDVEPSAPGRPATVRDTVRSPGAALTPGAAATPPAAVRRRGATVVLAAALALGLSACGDGEEEGGQARPPTAVEAVVAERDTIQVSVRSVGSLEADAQVEMRAEAEGLVERILFREGETVRRGEVLVLIDQKRLRSEVRAAEAAAERARVEAENLRRQVERNRGLLEGGAISRQAFDDLETRHEVAEAGLGEARAEAAVARERLREATVRAPFAGRAGERAVSPGDFVQRGDSLLTLVADDSLEIGFSVPERYVGRLRVGSPVTLTVQSYPDRAFEGSVTFVSPLVDPTNRTVRLKARVPNVDRALRSGQFANVRLGLERRPDAVVVPEAAVVPRGGRTFVFLVERGTARRREVDVGERSRGIVEVASGVQAGDTVVVAGQQKLQDGSPVAPEVRPLRLEVEPAGATVVGDSPTAGAAAGSAAAASARGGSVPPAPPADDGGTGG